MAIVELKGRSLKGKNRVREWGTVWVVKPLLRFPPNLDLIAVVAENDKKMTSLRWIHPKHDVDFEVVKWKEKDDV